jgi:hypothetical protein
MINMIDDDGKQQQEQDEQQQFKEYLAEQSMWFKKTLADFEKMFGGKNESISKN